MMFSTNEREFLRLAALSDPDWMELRRLSLEAMNWGLLQQIAFQHQLGGIVAWRCIDDRLDGICPELVRQASRDHLAYLATRMEPQRDEWQTFLEMLNKLGIPYFLPGGPFQYAPLRLPKGVWPRAWEHLNVGIPFAHGGRTQEISKATGAEDVWPRPSEILWRGQVEGTDVLTILRLPGGAEIEVFNTLPVDHYPHGEATWDMFSRRVEMTACGLRGWMAPAEVLLADYAKGTWASVFYSSTPLPLWGLARLANWSREADVRALAALLQHDLAVRLKADNMLLGLSTGKYQANITSTNAVAYTILWILGLARQVYEVFPGVPLEDLIAPYPLVTPRPVLWVRDEALSGISTYNKHLLCDWGTLPPIEEMLFSSLRGTQEETITSRSREGWFTSGKEIVEEESLTPKAVTEADAKARVKTVEKVIVDA
jgi:hypothetical protein